MSLKCVDRSEDRTNRVTAIRDNRGRIEDLDFDRRENTTISFDELHYSPVRKISDISVFKHNNNNLKFASSALLMATALFHKVTNADAVVVDGQYVDSINK